MLISESRGVSDTPASEWAARCDLAAAHRLCVDFGWGNLNLNHLSLRLDDEPDRFLIKPHSLLFEEITASSLRKVAIDAAPPNEVDDDINAAGFVIHAGLLKAKPKLNCIVHVHTKAGMAMSAHPGGLLPMTQGSMRFYNRLGYHAYEGIADQIGEAERLAVDLGDHKAMILRNHGLLTAGETIGEAMSLMRYLVNACETQLMLEGTGSAAMIPSPEVCEYTAQQWERFERNSGGGMWTAMLRTLECTSTSYRS